MSLNETSCQRFPDIKSVHAVIQSDWDLGTFQLRPFHKTVRLFRLIAEGDRYFVRINFDREALDAAGIVEFVRHLGQSDCGVPRILPAKSGASCAPIGEAVVSIESVLPGEECSSDRLDVLEAVGHCLAQIHAEAISYAARPCEKRACRPYVQRMLQGALNLAANGPHKRPIEQLRAHLQSDHARKLDTEIPFTVTHGDVCARNVLVHRDQVSFTDFYVPFAPPLIDVAMTRTKWLLGEAAASDRPLTLSEVGRIVRGYLNGRSVTDEEQFVFGVLASSYYAKRFARDAQILERKSTLVQSAYDIHNAISSLVDSIDEIA